MRLVTILWFSMVPGCVYGDETLEAPEAIELKRPVWEQQPHSGKIDSRQPDNRQPHTGPLQNEQLPNAAPSAADLRLCEALATRNDDRAVRQARKLARCAERYACSRKMWRPDIVSDVYACVLSHQHARADPTLDCLKQAVETVGETEAEAAFIRALSATDEQCDTFVEATAGQSDRVFFALTSCLLANTSCEKKRVCSELAIELLVDEICGAPSGVGSSARLPIPTSAKRKLNVG